MDTEQLLEAFASKFKIAVRLEDNSRRLRELESILATRLPPSFESVLHDRGGLAQWEQFGKRRNKEEKKEKDERKA